MYEKLHTLYKKHREVVMYIFFGGLTTLVYFVVRFSLYSLGMDLNIAQIITWICSVTFAFFANKIFVFRNKSANLFDWLKQGGQFYGARLTTLGIELLFMNLTVKVIGLSEASMIIAVQVFTLTGNYLISKFWVFKKKKDDLLEAIQETEQIIEEIKSGKREGYKTIAELNAALDAEDEEGEI